MQLEISSLGCLDSPSFAVYDPATGEEAGRCREMSLAECLECADAAGAAFASWAQTPVTERERILVRAADLMTENREALASIITREQGKPLAEARDEVTYGIGFVRWYAAEARRTYGTVVPSPAADKRLLVFREPVGPVLVITAGNDPFAMVTRKGAPALAAGCSILVKPACDTPFAALAIARLFEEAGLPKGVFSVVTTTKAPEVCTGLLKHDAIRHVTFTGSTGVGKQLASLAGSLVKGTTLELGGHAPFVVFDDASLELAVEDLVARKFTNAGQTCSCPARIFLHEAIARTFLNEFEAKARRITVGPGTDPAVDMGPLLNRSAVAKVQRHVADAVRLGAKVVTGGSSIESASGTFYPPTILVDIQDDMLLAREETFGPVAAFYTFDSEEGLASRVNHSHYGLAAYVYTRDMGRAFRTAERFRCGFVGVNDRRPQGPEVPMGGVRESGFGREGGKWGIEEFTTVKLTSMRF